MRARPYFARLGLRGRTIMVFGAMALVLYALTAVSVWYTVTTYLLGQRQDAATAQAASHVEQLTTTLGERATTPPEQLARLPRSVGAVSVLLLDNGAAADRVYTTSLVVTRETLPPELLQRVAAGQPARQRVQIDGQPTLIVGAPIPEAGGTYFELVPLVELEQTFTVLGAVLVAGAVAMPLGTVALAGWALRPALRPLERVSAVARAVAAGDLGARLDPGRDAALVPIAASFNATAASLERRVRADAQFAADVSHELRSPLTAMMGAVGLIAHHRASLPEEGAEMVDLLEAEVGRFASLVEDLLEISRLEAGSADLTLEDVRLADLVGHTVPEHILDRVEMTDAGNGAVVRLDKLRMERVLANLIDNAERHGQGVSRIGVDAAGATAAVTVEDQGPGLADEELDRIFDRFARSRRTGRESTTGAGLGLSLVARHLQLMHGDVHAENKEGGGARFTVTVPTTDQEGDRACV